LVPPSILVGEDGRFYVDSDLSVGEWKRYRALQERAFLDGARISWLKHSEFERKATLLLEQIEQTAPEPSPAEPPSAMMLSLMMPASTSEEIIENMEDIYRDNWVPRYGKRRADWIWRWQVVQFILWRWTWPVMSLLGALKLIKLG